MLLLIVSAPALLAGAWEASRGVVVPALIPRAEIEAAARALVARHGDRGGGCAGR